MTEFDLFGEVPKGVSSDPKVGPKGGKHYVKQRGYAALPGTGPAGETCGSCQHMVGRGGRFRKCALIEPKWTHSPRTDVLARSPACLKWRAISPESQSS